jgi:hypothetical protein
MITSLQLSSGPRKRLELRQDARIEPDMHAAIVLWSSMVTMTACAIAHVASYRGVILMQKDIRSPVLFAKHATDMEAQGASSSPLKIQTETTTRCRTSYCLMREPATKPSWP